MTDKTANNERDTSDVGSPCVRNCCLDESDICLGCFRSLDEIMGWTSSSTEQKQRILSNCISRRKLREAGGDSG